MTGEGEWVGNDFGLFDGMGCVAFRLMMQGLGCLGVWTDWIEGFKHNFGKTRKHTSKSIFKMGTTSNKYRHPDAICLLY